VGALAGALGVVGVLAFSAGGAAASMRVAPLIPLSKVRNDSVTSTNWSGYAVQDASKFTDVTGTWVQPKSTCNTTSATYAAFWAGIDGYATNSVEQLGTDSDCTGLNKPNYYAWYEMYPAASVQLSTTTYPVKPGDTLSARVSVSGTSFTLSLTSSEGWHFTTVQSSSKAAQGSAELIAESPEICTLIFCHLAKLTNFGTVNFSGVQAAVGGADQPFSSFTADSGPHKITAVTSSGVVRAQPSPLSATGNAFGITWEHS
jgi:hypothetical protein